MKKKTSLGLTALLMLAFAILVWSNSLPVHAETNTPTDLVCPYSFDTETKTLYEGWNSYFCDIKGIHEKAEIVYRSEDESVATVSDEGEIAPVAAGTTLIIADVTEGDSTYTCSMQVTVKKPYTKVAAKTKAMTIDSSFRFKLKRYGHRSSVSWVLSGEGLAEITAASATDCIIKAKAPGTVTLTATCNDQTFSFKIKIYNGKGELFIISPDSKPCNSYYEKMSTYNSKTKGYYLLRSYLEKLNSTKGGVLVLKKGTYSITNTLCIPSNTTIILENGATVLKTDDTGTSYLPANASLFHTVSYTNASKEGIFSGYNGEKNISILGEGIATIDINNIKCQCIVSAHTNNLTISGITFKNMNTYHFIEICGSQNVTISNNYFYGSSASSTTRKEAINIDTPDEVTNGFHQYWTSYDKTPAKDIYITDNVFYEVECGVGTHKYTEGKMHENINILRNTFIDCKTYAIRAMNWNKPVIRDNSFVYPVLPEYAQISIIVNGSINPLITENRFENIEIPVSFYHWKNTVYGSDYAPIYNKLSKSYAAALKMNYVVNVPEPYYEYYSVLDDFEEENRKTYLIDGYLVP